MYKLGTVYSSVSFILQIQYTYVTLRAFQSVRFMRCCCSGPCRSSSQSASYNLDRSGCGRGRIRNRRGPRTNSSSWRKDFYMYEVWEGAFQSHFLPENCQDDRRNDGVLPELSLDLSGDLKGGNLF